MRILKFRRSIKMLETGEYVWLKIKRDHISFVVHDLTASEQNFDFHRRRFKLSVGLGYSSESPGYQEQELGEFGLRNILSFYEQSFVSLYTLGSFIHDTAKAKSESQVICQMLAQAFNNSVNLYISISRDQTVVFKSWVYDENDNTNQPKDLEFKVEVPLEEIKEKITWSNPSFAIQTA